MSTTTSTLAASIPDSIAARPVLDLEGATAPFGSLWRERPAFVFFVRHFG